MPDYPIGVTTPKNYPTRLALAERDGGWTCFYCSTPVIDDLNPDHFEQTTIESCAGGHHDVYPCDQGCVGSIFRMAAHGRRWAQVDHVLPRSRGGSNNLVNLVLACSDCNSRKGARTPGEWLGKAA